LPMPLIGMPEQCRLQAHGVVGVVGQQCRAVQSKNSTHVSGLGAAAWAGAGLPCMLDEHKTHGKRQLLVGLDWTWFDCVRAAWTVASMVTAALPSDPSRTLCT
jgi:hypothetical protein